MDNEEALTFVKSLFGALTAAMSAVESSEYETKVLQQR